MKPCFGPTLNRQVFLVADAGDEHAPLLTLKFHSEFGHGLSYEQRYHIAKEALGIASKMCMKFLGGSNEVEQTDNP